MQCALKRNARSDALLLIAQVAALWPVWTWYVTRMTDGSDEPWGVLALIAAVALAVFKYEDAPAAERAPLLWTACLSMLGYVALVFAGAAPLLRALVGVTALACTAIAVCGIRRYAPVIIGLALLSLPVLASLQFYGGYALRLLTTSIGSGILQVFGMDVAHLGTTMTWHGTTVLVDAPCSGVRMLWTATFLLCVLWMQRPSVNWRAFVLSLIAVVPIVIVGNALRAAGLFWVATRTTGTTAVHELIGVVAFVVVGVSILGIQAMLANRFRNRCGLSGYRTFGNGRLR